MSKVLFYQKATKANTCPECRKALMLPYYPHGFKNKGIIQCVECDYSRYVEKATGKQPHRDEV